MRLTKKNEAFLGGYQPLGDYTDLCSKFGPLEDIEEELGINLITYFHFYFGKPLFLKDSTGKIRKIKNTGWVYHPIRKSFVWFHKGMEEIQLFVKDYGKTWAFTKEELE